MAAALMIAIPPLALTSAAPAQAAFAPGGSGLYKGAIDWITWGTDGAGVVNKQRASSTRIIDGQRLTTTCEIDKISKPILAYRSGSWKGDSLDNLYNTGGSGDKNQMVYALRNAQDGALVSFEVTCSASLQIGELMPVAVPLGGLVVADAESSGDKEYIQATPIPANAPSTWRIIERLRAPGCSTALIAKRTGSTLEMRPKGNECSPSPENVGGPMAIGYLDGATSAKITMKGGGNSAVALGTVLESDFGDAPESYGSAGALFARDWTGGDNLPEGITGTNVSDNTFVLGTPKQPRTRLGALTDSDIDHQPSISADADDRSGVDDEDAIAPLGRVSVVPRQNYTLDTVACTGPGYVAGWIDWNVNGKFDANERSAPVQCTGASVTLSWTVPADVKTTPGQDKSFLRLRIAANQAGVDSPTGMTTTGEVEDHPLQISTPTLTIQKSVSTRVAAADQFTLTLLSSGQSVGTATTSGAEVGVQVAAVGPMTVAPGQVYFFSEAMAAGSASVMGEYVSSYQCTASYPNGSQQALGALTQGTAGSVTIPAIVAGQGTPAINCIFSNDPAAASLVVEKQWIVNGTEYQHGEQPKGLEAQLTLAHNGPAASHEWGKEKVGHAAGQVIDIAETMTIASSMPGCTVDSQTLMPAGGVESSLPGSMVLKAGQNIATVTNTIQCSTELTLAKNVHGGAASASDWMLTAIADSGDGIFSGTTGVKHNVTAGVKLHLAESGGSPLYVQDDSRSPEDRLVSTRSTGSWSCVAMDGEGNPVTGVVGAREGINGTLIPPLGSKITCTATNRTAQLSILKFVENTNGTGTGVPEDWNLTATPHDGVPGLSVGTVEGSSAVTERNTIQVRPGHSYELSESGTVGGYTQLALQRFTGSDPAVESQLADPANWEDSKAAVSVAADGSEVYRFVNRDAVRYELPLTGGSGSWPYLAGGGIIIAVAVGGATLAVRRRRTPGND
ncbi:hypothetical protein ART_1300 [Arthrobacter sp. PAMC 25486]|nr:hypothetical protein ART_1300 [Arthrobacter sp. PAMC 25486]